MPRKPTQTLRQFRPKLAKQLVNPKDGNLAKGSSKKVKWKCLNHKGLVYEARVDNRAYGKNQSRCGCPVCNGKKVVPGINDIATTHPDVAKLFVDKKMALQHTAKSNKKALFQCKKGHPAWEVVISNVTGGTRCPYCSGRKAIPGENSLAETHPELARELVDVDKAIEIKAGSNTKQKWKCLTNPNHPIWVETVYNRTYRNHVCPHCSGKKVTTGINDLNTTHPKLALQLKKPKQGHKTAASSTIPIEWICKKCNHIWSASPFNRTVVKTGCPVCTNRTVIPEVNSLAKTNPEVLPWLADPNEAKSITKGSNKKLTWKCPEGHTWQARTHTMIPPQIEKCRDCNPRSVFEQQVSTFIQSLLSDAEIIYGDKSILENREIDIVIPGLKIAIECNGVWWHSSAVERIQKNPDYHSEKSQLARKKGYTLIHIWEDDWDLHPGFIKNQLTRLIEQHRSSEKSKKSNTPHNFTIERIDDAQTLDSWNKKHPQKSSQPQVIYCLMDEHNCIHAALEIKESEIIRFSSLHYIPQALTRLIKYAEQDNPAIAQWFTVLDSDFPLSSEFKEAGFTLKRRLSPKTTYMGSHTKMRRVDPSEYHLKRFKSDPSLQYEKGWTLKEALKANRIYTIRNSGFERWTKRV